MRTLLVASILLLPLAAAAAAPPSGVFDKPLRTERVVLPKGNAEKRELTCFYFAGLRVKQLDLGEVGAAELAILPLAPSASPIACRRQAAPGEIVIPSKAWSGYFKGVRSGFVVFDAEDGSNGGLGFAVFDGRDGRKLFEDMAVGNIRAAEAAGAEIRLRYRRALLGKCSVPHDGAACWARIAAQMAGVTAAAEPDCAAGYLKAKTEMARGRCEAQHGDAGCLDGEMKRLDEQRWNETPSVIGYDVEADIGPSGHSVRATGGALSCWPAD
jgi:hypothetical protein